MKKTAVVHIYNFIRMSHTEPSRFIPDDFETLREQLILIKQYGFPGTYALKYDALTEPRYQALLKEYLDEWDELGAWWEITEPLCRRAGIRFRDSRDEQVYDDRVDSAYSLGYEPEERRRLVDAYMADFYAAFGCFPSSIGSWVLDEVTVAYAHRRYGVSAACICRDQMGVDGFTLWGGWPNGVYLPSRHNLFIPASSEENRLDVPVFRLLGPDPIYNFEADVRGGLQGVYTLEPSWLAGRDPDFIRDYFENIADDKGFGIGYAQVGQENNFLWENIRPGMAPQLDVIAQLVSAGKIRLETMAATARWFAGQYRLTPPLMLQNDADWTGGGLCAQWFACVNYRLGLLGEKEHLRIRDLFLYREGYSGRYLDRRMKGTKSTFDALPLLFPQVWGGAQDRPFIRFVDKLGTEATGEIRFDAPEEGTARAQLFRDGQSILQLRMDPEGITLSGHWHLRFDRLPVLREVRDGTRRLCLFCYRCPGQDPAFGSGKTGNHTGGRRDPSGLRPGSGAYAQGGIRPRPGPLRKPGPPCAAHGTGSPAGGCGLPLGRNPCGDPQQPGGRMHPLYTGRHGAGSKLPDLRRTHSFPEGRSPSGQIIHP